MWAAPADPAASPHGLPTIAGELAEREHRWAGILGSSPATTIPMERFGASDCRCRSHLFGFAARPRVSAFRAWLETTATPLDVARCPYRSL